MKSMRASDMGRNFCLLLLLLAASCTNDIADDVPGVANVTFDICSGMEPDTRAGTAASEDWERKIDCLDLIVFSSSDRSIVNHLRTQSAGPVDMSLKAGGYVAWAVVNAPDILASVKTEAEFKNIGLMLRDDDGGFNSVENGMVQANSNGEGILFEIKPGENVSLTLEVKRFVSRVVLKKIENALPMPCSEMTVKNVFLSNVSLYRTIGRAYNALNLWGNAMGRSSDSGDGVIDGETNSALYPELTFLSLDAQLSRGESYTASHSFYAYQNSPSEDNTGWSPQWSQRMTRLVVTASYDGVKYYYPVSIPVLNRNCSYEVSLKILGPGSVDPDIPVKKESVEIAVDVSDCSFFHSGSTSDEEIL